MQQDSKSQQAATQVMAQNSCVVRSHFDQARAAVPTICMHNLCHFSGCTAVESRHGGAGVWKPSCCAYLQVIYHLLCDSVAYRAHLQMLLQRTSWVYMLPVCTALPAQLWLLLLPAFTGHCFHAGCCSSMKPLPPWMRGQSALCRVLLSGSCRDALPCWWLTDSPQSLEPTRFLVSWCMSHGRLDRQASS